MNNLDRAPSNIIQQTREDIQNMNKQQRFRKAKRHLLDAIAHRSPRNDYQKNHSEFFKTVYSIQTSTAWNNILYFLSFVFMYLIIGQPTNRKHKGEPINLTIIILEVFILFMYWLDLTAEIYHKQSWKIETRVKFPMLFKLKSTLVILMTIDTLIYYPLYKSFPIRVFRILRTFLPYCYNKFARKTLQSFVSIYRDICCYTIFYFSIVFAFGIVGTQLINLPMSQFDFYKTNYDNVGQASFLFYILASFDSWPDYWQPVLDQSKWFYILFVSFIFLNYFYFVTIPTTVMFNSFKKTRSGLMLIDDIQQQNSLLLCFICLGEDNLCIKSETFHQFMLYAYRNKLRLIDHIKQFSFRLGGHHNSQIFISDFMKICKIIQQQPQMCPPMFDDWQPYIRFRKFLKDKLYLKKIIKSLIFDLIVIATAILNILILIISPFVETLNNIAVQYFFVVSFEVEVLMRLLGTGIEKYCSRTGNLMQLGLSVFYLLLIGLSGVINHSTLTQLLSLLRLFRIPRVFNIMLVNNYFKRFYFKNVIFRKLRTIFTDLYVSISIGIKMAPLFMTLYYILGVIGIESYDETFHPQQSSPYSVYDKYANFRTFLFSQIVIVQSMIEAGWSMIIFDHSYRFGHTILVYLYFIMIHIFVDTTIFSLMKGMVADLYETIALQFEQLDKLEEQELENEKIQQEKKDQIAEIRKILEEGVSLGYDSLKKKEIYQNKLDRQIMESLKAALLKKQHKNFKRIKTLRSVILARSAGQILKQRQQIRTQPKMQVQKQKQLQRPKSTKKIKKQTRPSIQLQIIKIPQKQESIQIKSIHQTEEQLQLSKGEQQSLDSDSSISIGDSDIQEIQDNLLDRIILREQQIPYAQAPVYPKFLLQFLGKKMIIAKQKIQKQGPFNPNIMGIRSKSSLSFYTNVLQALLDIKKSESQRKQQIAMDILKLRVDISNVDINRNLEKKSFQKTVLINPIIRKIMLSNISQEFMKKFQVQYFSSVYGNSFRQINRSTLDPLLRHQSLMLYNLHRTLRYPPNDIQVFWNILATIQDNISRTLLHIGSIFTFVFEVEQLAGNWFAIEVRQNMEIKVHFLKTGIWIYHRGMRFNDVYYGRDIFYCDDQELASSQNSEKTIKLLYNAFQTLGFSMLNQTNFFDSDPARHYYDLFTFVLDCKNTEKRKENIVFQSQRTDRLQQNSKNFNLKITKMMGVVLSRQYERPPGKELKYELTSLKKILEQQLDKKKQKVFRFDQDQTKTYQKLQHLASDDYQRLIDSQSLEYAFIVDAVESIRDSCEIHLDNLIEQAQIIVNRQFSKVGSKV